MATIRTRFAPSPTGFLHVGNIRTGLFAWLVARHFKGQFILRLEDTDKRREVVGAEAHLTACLKALGLNYDEGPDIGGPFGPYRQSERAKKVGVYDIWAHRLLQAGRAYVDPYTPDQVQAFREQAKREERPFLYRNYRPEQLSIQWDIGMTLRFKSEPKNYEWHDEVMGDLRTGPEVIDDFVLVKADGYPTYNFAHIVDDAEMRITHVIRGQEFIASVPNYLNLYEALGFTPPIMATMPHILGSAGTKKLGKRDGAKDVLDYLREGILPDALVNFIASLGWNDGTEQEIFSREELIAKFSLARVGRGGARFDEQRLLWMNGHYLRQLPLEELYQQVEGQTEPLTIANARVRSFWPTAAQTVDVARKKQVLALVQDRLKTLADVPVLTEYFFSEPIPDWSLVAANQQLRKLEKHELSELLKQTHEALAQADFTEAAIANVLNQLLQQTGQKPAVLFGLIRLALTWAPFSPGLAETIVVLGKKTTLERLERATMSL